MFGLQWLAITTATVIIIGKVVAGLHFDDFASQLVYMQKLFFVVAVALFSQVLWGHRLPLITGPATVLLVGIVAGAGSDIQAVYTTVAVGGAFLVVLSVTGLFSMLTRFFTSRVVATILILIALTITPTILSLILTAPSPDRALLNLGFALTFMLVMIAADRLLKGIWKSTMIVWAIIAGSLLVQIIAPADVWRDRGQLGIIAPFFTDFTTRLSWEPGLLISFLFCFIALAINDLGSIQAVGRLVDAPAMNRRVTAGVTYTGLSNILAGFFGVIGPVNFSLSTGIIAANGNAARFTLIPTGLALLAIAFLPGVVAFVWNVPAVVVGTILLYIMSSQLAAGLMVAFGSGGFSFRDGLIISVPAMISIIVSYLPDTVKAALPPVLMPIVGNGFVMGVLAVLILEHIVYRTSSVTQQN
ncbi:MAG: solute carrier family 23 protein [Desulfobacterales bacterium]